MQVLQLSPAPQQEWVAPLCLAVIFEHHFLTGSLRVLAELLPMWVVIFPLGAVLHVLRVLPLYHMIIFGKIYIVDGLRFGLNASIVYIINYLP